MARNCDSVHIFPMPTWSQNLPKLSYLELHPFGMSHKMTGRFFRRDDIHFIWSKLAKSSFLKDLTKARIPIAIAKKDRHIISSNNLLFSDDSISYEHV